MNELDNARKTINEIDTELVRLFEERMHAVARIAAYKMENGLPVFDAAREAANIERTAGLISDPALREFFRKWYQMTMDISKEYQKGIIRSADEV